MKILAIETSCDETSAAVIEGSRGKVKILSNIVASQINIHKKYGGVVPEVAARNHILNVIPVVAEALRESECFPRQNGGQALPPRIKGGKREIGEALKEAERDKKSPLVPLYKRGKSLLDLIAVTGGPGLMSSLLIGAETADTLAYTWKKPLIVINHIEAHIYANWLKPAGKFKVQSSKFKIEFPVLALVVSGGHTQLVLMRDHLKYKTIGQTRDDAAGEAFDKVAKILGLGYPGGPVISKMAALNPPACLSAQAGAGRSFFRKWGKEIRLPRPMLDSDNFDFSFSGLKTAVLYLAREIEKKVSADCFKIEIIPAICAEFQQAVIDVLVCKTVKAARKYNAKTVLLAGGVAANRELRKQMDGTIKSELGGKIIFNVPEQNLCTDNAAMVGVAAYYRYKEKPQSAKAPSAGIKVEPNGEL